LPSRTPNLTDFLCAVADISSKKLSRALNGIQPLTGLELAYLLKIIEDLKGLANDASPYPVAFRRADLIKKMLEQRRAGLRLIPIAVGPQEAIVDFEMEFEAKQ